MVAQARLQLVGQELLDLLGLLARAAKADVLQPHILEARDPVRELLGQDLAQEVGESVLRRPDEIPGRRARSEEHTSELQSLMRISYAVFCLKKKTKLQDTPHHIQIN